MVLCEQWVQEGFVLHGRGSKHNKYVMVVHRDEELLVIINWTHATRDC